MIPVPSGVRVWLAVGRTDMRRGMNGLALQVQEALCGVAKTAINQQSRLRPPHSEMPCSGGAFFVPTRAGRQSGAQSCWVRASRIRPGGRHCVQVAGFAMSF